MTVVAVSALGGHSNDSMTSLSTPLCFALLCFNTDHTGAARSLVFKSLSVNGDGGCSAGVCDRWRGVVVSVYMRYCQPLFRGRIC